MMTVSMPSTAYYPSDAKNSYAPVAAGQAALLEQRGIGQSVMKNALLSRTLDNNPYGSQPPSIPSASLSAAIASSLSLADNHQGLSRLEDVPLELLSRNISFHCSPSAPLDVLIKSRIEKMPNSLVLVNNSKADNEAVCPNLRVYQQEDAHEYLLGILSKMEDSVLAAYGKMPRATMDTNVIRRLFGGTTRSEEVLQGANAYKCEACKQLRHATRCCRISRAPPVLVIQFNRFSRNQKLDTRVDFPATFNVRPHMTPSRGPSVIYRLYATLNHEGYSCRSGHYVAFTRRNDQWFSHNDSIVTSTTQECVLRQSPYLLFYELVSLDMLKSGAAVAVVANSTPSPSRPKPQPLQHTFTEKLSDSDVTTNNCVPPNGPFHPFPSRVSPEAPEQRQSQTQKPKPAIIFNPHVLACNKPIPHDTSNTTAVTNGIRPDEVPKAVPVTTDPKVVPVATVPIAAVIKAVPSSLLRSSSIPVAQTLSAPSVIRTPLLSGVSESVTAITANGTSLSSPTRPNPLPSPKVSGVSPPSSNHSKGPSPELRLRSRSSSGSSEVSSSGTGESIEWIPVTKADLQGNAVCTASAEVASSSSRKRKHNDQRYSGSFSSTEKQTNFSSHSSTSKHRKHKHKKWKRRRRRSAHERHNS
ncbi:unnamed protein product [Schistocephalus solidus]|uniref:USP domain-containing protein n=1 Tax=Schistocephalus solidus TaxID=70667 RepID=A0A183SQ24_SCHSO|nr:unnamed protein product [Schistocephalus solidus]